MQSELNKAIETLSTATNVAEWNEKREYLKYRTSTSIISQIDVSGLCVQILGKDGSTKAPILSDFGDDLD